MNLTSEQRSRMGRRNRDRGKTVQREYARFNCAIWDIEPEGHVVYTCHHPDNCYMDCPGEGNHVEVKGEKSFRFPSYIREAERDAVRAAAGKDTLGAGSHWWIAAQRPFEAWRSYRHQYYVLAPELHYLERCVEAWTTWDWQDVIPRIDGELIELRRALRCFRNVVVDYREDERWVLGTWIPEIEELAQDLPWAIVLEAPKSTEAHSYLHTHYLLLPGRDWALLLQESWTKRRRD